MTSIECEFENCNWKSPSGSLETVLRFLEIHVIAKHSSHSCENASAKNRVVNRVKLKNLKQFEDEPIRRFADRVRHLANACVYSINCTSCNSGVSYTDEVIKDQVIAGIRDPETQRDMVSQETAENCDLEKLLTFAESKEVSRSLLNPVYRQDNREKCQTDVENNKRCRYCGNRHSPGKKNCEAADNICENCNKVGHFGKVCRRKKKAGSRKKSTESEAAESGSPNSMV